MRFHEARCNRNGSNRGVRTTIPFFFYFSSYLTGLKHRVVIVGKCVGRRVLFSEILRVVCFFHWKLVFVSLKQVEALGLYCFFIVVPHCSNIVKNIFFLNWFFIIVCSIVRVARFSKFQHVPNVKFFNVRLERLFSFFFFFFFFDMNISRWPRDVEVLK